MRSCKNCAEMPFPESLTVSFACVVLGRLPRESPSSSVRVTATYPEEVYLSEFATSYEIRSQQGYRETDGKDTHVHNDSPPSPCLHGEEGVLNWLYVKNNNH